jgi:hypothetical protein
MHLYSFIIIIIIILWKNSEVSNQLITRHLTVRLFGGNKQGTLLSDFPYYYT